MMWLSLAVCLFTLWQVSVSGPVHDSKVAVVDLAYSCLKADSDRGQDDHVPIIIIHGLSSFKESWKGIDEVLSRETGKQVCTIDLRNHGESPWSNETDTATMSNDVKHLLDKLNFLKAVVLGHSLGGKVAAHFALKYPERIEKVIIEDMRPNGISPEGLKEVTLYAQLLKDVNSKLPQGVSEQEAKEIFYKYMSEELAKKNVSLPFEDPALFAIKCTDGKCRWGANTLLFEVILEDINNLLSESTGRFEGPALFLYGTESNFKVGDDESNIKELFPNAQIVGVKGAGHMVHLFPEFIPEVTKFINEK